MSAELKMSGSDVAIDFPYRAVSRTALFSLVFGVLGAIGLIPTFSPMLILTVPGILCGIASLRSIANYPDEFSGKSLAIVGLVISASLLVGGVAMHTVIYLTEVPEGYERVAFYQLQAEQNAPDLPTPLAMEIDGDSVFLKGYIHPSSGNGLLRQFILVPDLGTCCFGGQPRSTDMIEVTLPAGESVKATLTKRKLAGTFRLNRLPRQEAGFDNALFYKMNVDTFR